MTKMRTVDAIVEILRKEGVSQAFGVPGAAINPLYSAMKERGGIDHILARHVEAASHMAEGYTRARAGNIGLCIGTSGPAGTDMITALYSATADSIPILCITGQAPVAKLDKEDFQGVDIASIAKPVTKMAKTVLEPAQVPGVFAKAFQLMRSDRPGPVLIDLPADIQRAEIEFDIDLYEPLPISKPAMTRIQAEKVMELVANAKKPILLAGGGIINADASDLLVELAELTGVPVISTLMGWGCIPDDHKLANGMAGIQTSQPYANATMLESDVVVGIGNRWANRMTGDLDVFRKDRQFVHIDIEPTQIGRVFPADLGIVSDAKLALQQLLLVAKQMKKEGKLPDQTQWAKECQQRKARMQRKTNYNCEPLKPFRVYQAMNAVFGPETRYVTTIGLSQIAAAQMLHVYKPRHWLNAGQAGPLGWTAPAAIGAAVADKDTPVVALSGDFDFQFLIEEIAVGAQFNIPWVHIVVNNAYLGLIRQSQREFDMDYHVQLSFENVNAPETGGYGADHVGAVEALGGKAIRVFKPEDLETAMEKAKLMAEEYQLPVVVECILERVTNISMGSALDNVHEFNDMAETSEDAPTAILALEESQ
ncbi:MAG: glyoxylate carboligase [Actinomycetaceae bacterium]|nr:glyoxylate carboligase [Actinomycetaceae bacterium]